jgi:protein O-GlcNAc transferase
LMRLPGCFLCYLGPSDTPAVSASPAARNGNVTFCSFNNIAKIQPTTVKLWARVLSETPGTRMIIKAKALSDPRVSTPIIEMFQREGVNAERIDIRGYSTGVIEHLSMYADVDIALDSWPYNGTTTTCEALWMGVPVLSLSGPVHASRVGTTLLRAVGLGSLAVDTPEAFVRIAGILTSDIARLAKLRAGLRISMSQSDLCNAERFSKAFGEAIEVMTHTELHK